MSRLNSFVKNIIKQNIPDEDTTGMVPIHPEIFVRHKSLNLLIAKPGCGKTTSICQELIKIGLVNKQIKMPSHFHLIIWVNNTSSDKTVNELKDYFNIPILQLDYETFNDFYPEFLKKKELYNKIIKGESEPVPEILNDLYLDDFYNVDLETIIVLDDAVHVLKDTESFLAKSLYRTRHTNCLFFIAIQIWRGITAQLKSILNSVWIFGGFSNQILRHIYNQITTDISFEDFKSGYDSLEKYNKIICDCTSGKMCVD